MWGFVSTAALELQLAREALMNPSVQTVELPNKVHLPYVEQGDPAGPTLIFLHPVGDSWRAFDGLLSELPDSIHAFAPTQRGHGDASRPESGYRSKDFAEDLLYFMDALGIEAAFIAGGSSGGLATQCFAIDHPDRVRGLIFLGAPLRLTDNPMTPKVLESVSELTDPVDPEFVRDFAGGIVREYVSPETFEEMVAESMKVPAFVWKATIAGLAEDDFTSELPNVSAPALVMWGDQDRGLPRSDQEHLVELLQDARLIVYRGGGHMLYWQLPDQVAADIASFIEEHGREHR